MAQTTVRMPSARRSIDVGASAGQRKGWKGSGGPTSASRPVRAAKTSIRWTRRARRASAATVWATRSSAKATRAPSAPGGAADEPHAARLEGGQVEGRAVGPAHELERGLAAGDREVEDLVGRLVEDAHRVEPPEDVPPAVDARQPRVTAHRERHGPARGVDLVGELDARRRGPDDEDAALGELARVPVAARHHLDDVVRQAAARTAGTNGVSQCPVAITTLGASQAPRSVVTR